MELIRLIAGMQEPPDLCLLDINMPVMNGYETLVVLKKTYPDMKFLILSQHEHEYMIIRMLKAGANSYMLKDTEPAELKRAIRKIMDESFYNSRLPIGRLTSLYQKGKIHAKLSLSAREQEFLKLCCSELAYKEIAVKMNLTERTVAFYQESMFKKLDVKSRTGLALFAIKLGLVHEEQR